MKKKLLINMFVCLLLFSGCNREYLVDKDNIISIYDEAQNNKSEITADEGYDDEQSRYEADYASASENYIYFSNFDGSYILDINNMTYRNMCNVPGCTHSGISCEGSIEKGSIRYHKDGLYYLDGSSLYFRTDSGEVNKVFTNDFSTEWSQKMDPKNPQLLTGMIFIDENTLLLSGRNYYIKYDLTTQERTDAVVVPDGWVAGFCYSDGIIFSSYDNGKLVRTVWNTGESELVAELGSNVRLVNDRIWYAKYSSTGSTICSNNLSFTDEKVEIENTEVAFDVFDDMIIYTESYDRYYLYNQDGETRKLFNADDLIYSYDKLPQEYQYENKETEFKTNWFYFLNYDHEDIYFTARYSIRVEKATVHWYVFYKLDKDGNITELKNENEIQG